MVLVSGKLAAERVLQQLGPRSVAS